MVNTSKKVKPGQLHPSGRCRPARETVDCAAGFTRSTGSSVELGSPQTAQPDLRYVVAMAAFLDGAWT
jgi:hypothetical protein